MTHRPAPRPVPRNIRAHLLGHLFARCAPVALVVPTRACGATSCLTLLAVAGG